MSHSDLTSIMDVASDDEGAAESDAAIPPIAGIKKNLNLQFLEPDPPKPLKVLATVPGQDHMRVFLRIRPFSENELNKNENQKCVKVESEKTLTVNAPEGSHTYKNSQHGCGKQTHHFTFTRIFDENTSQKEFFDNTVLGTVKDFIDGQNCLVFTYGVTNSGKTYTIQGNPQDGGILPRSLDVIFNSVKDKLWKDMSLKPRMFSDVARLSETQEEQEQQIKESTLKLAVTDEPDMTTLLGDETSQRASLMSEDSLNKQERNSLSKDADSLDNQNRDSTSSVGTASTDPDQDMVKALMEEAENRVREEGRVSVEAQSMMKFSVWVSFTEVYNEYIYDLLEPIPKKKNAKRPILIMREDKNGIPYVKGLKQIQVTSADEAYKVLTVGKRNLQMASTKLNHNSSRSHCIFTVKILRVVDKDNPTHARVSMLSFCDLAGAERSSKTQSVGDRMKEAGNINTSLLALGNCIKALRHNQMFRDQQRIVPFRDSKLTRLFQSFFSGKGKAAMMVNINQLASAFDETLHALKYSAIAKQVITIQEPPKEKKSMPVIGSRRVLDSLALAPTPNSKSTSRATIAWGTPGTIAQDALDHVEEEEEEESDYSFSSREQELLDIITALKDELVSEKRRMLTLEMDIREEVCEEMSKQIVQIENSYGELLQEERIRAEEKAEKRIQLLMQSVKKDRKRRRVVDDEGNDHDDEYVSSVLLHQAEVKVTSLEKELDQMKTQMQELVKERDNLQTELSKAQFEAADLRTQMHKLQAASNSGDVDLAHSEVISSLQTQMNSLKEELQEKKTELAEMNEMLTEAGDTFHQKDTELSELQQRCKEQEETLSEMQQIAEDSRRAMEAANGRLQVKIDYISQLEQKLEKSVASEECVKCMKLTSRIEELQKQLNDSATVNGSEERQREEKEEVAGLTQNLAESEQKREELKATIEMHQQNVKDLELKCTHHDSKVAQLEKQLKDMQEDLKASSSGKNGSDKELIETKEKLRDVETRYLEVKLEIERKDRKIEEVRRSVYQTVEEKEDTVKKLKNEMQELKEKLHGVESKYLALTIEVERKDKRIEDDNRKSVATDEKVKMLEQTLQAANAALRESTTEAEKFKEKCGSLEKEIGRLRCEMTDKTVVSKCSDEMKDRCTMLERERDSLKAQCAQAEANILKQTADLENALAITATLRSDLDGLRGQLESHESCEQRLVELQDQLDDYILKVNEQVLIIGEYEDKVKEENKGEKNTTSDLEKKIAELETKLERERKQHKDATEELDSLLQQKSVTIEELRTNISTLDNKLRAVKDVENKLQAAESESQSLKQKVASQEQQSAVASDAEVKLQDHIKECESKIAKLEEQLTDVINKESAARAQVKTLEDEIASLKSSLKAVEDNAVDVEEVEEKLKVKAQDLIAAEKRIKELEQIVDKAENSQASDNEREEKLNARIREMEGLVCEADYKAQMNSRQLGREKRQVESRLKEKEDEMVANEKKLNELLHTLSEMEEKESKGDSELSARYDEQKKRADRLESIVEDLESCLTSTKVAHENASQQVEKWHTKCKKLESELQEFENQLEDAVSAKDDLANQLSELEGESRQNVKNAEEQNVDLRQQLQDAHIKLEHVTQCLHEKSSLEADVSEASQRLQQARDDGHQLKQALMDSQRQVEKKETQYQELKKQLSAVENKLKIQIDDMGKKVVELETELVARNSALEEVTGKLESSNKKASALEEKVSELTAALDEKKSEFDTQVSDSDLAYNQLEKEHNLVIKAKNEVVAQLLESKEELGVLQQQLDEKSEQLEESKVEAEKITADLKTKINELLATQKTLTEEKTHNVGQLEEQVKEQLSNAEEQAKRITELEKELADAAGQAECIKDLEGQLSAAGDQNKNMADLESALTESKERCKHLEEVEGSLSELRAEHAEVTKTLALREASVESYSKQIELLNEETSILNQQVEKMTTTESALKATMSALRAELDNKNTKISDLEEDIKKKATAETDHRALLDDLDKAVARENHLRQQLREATQAQEEQNVKFNVLNAKLETSQEEVEKQSNNLKTANASIKSLKEELAGSQQQQKAVNQELEEAQHNKKSQIATRDEEIARLKEDLEKKENKIRQRSNNITELMSKLDAERNSYEIALRDAKVNERIIETMKAAMDEQEATMATQDKVLQDREQRIAQLLKDYDEEVKKNDDLRKSSRNNSSAVTDLNDRVSRLELERKRLEESSFAAETKLREAKRTCEHLEKERAQLEKAVQDKNESVQQLEKKLSESEEVMTTSLNQQIKLAEVQSQMEQERKAGHDSDHKLSLLKSKFQVLEERNKGLEEQRNRLEADLKKLQQQQQQNNNKDNEAELKRFREDRDKLVSQLEGILRENTSKLAEMQRKLKDVAADNDRLKREVQDKDDTIAELSAFLEQGQNTRSRRGRSRAAEETHDEPRKVKQMSGPSEAEALALKEVEDLHRQLEEQRLTHSQQLNKVLHAKDAIINELRDTNLQLQTQIPMANSKEDDSVPATPSQPKEVETTTSRGRRKTTRGAGRTRKRKSSETESIENMTPQEPQEPTSRRRVSRQSTTTNKRRGRRTAQAQMQVSFTEGGPLDVMPIQEEDVMDLSNADVLASSTQSSRHKQPLSSNTANHLPMETPDRGTFISPDKSISTSTRKKKRLLNVEEELFKESPPLDAKPPTKIHDDTPKQVLRNLRTRSTRNKKNTAV